jgi:hypothetical protein
VTFTATPTNGGSTPLYQWKVNGANVGTNINTYSFVPANNDLITCVLTSNVTCAAGSPATSNIVTMTVNALPIPTLTSSDADNILCSGTSVTFTAGGGTSYNFRVGGFSMQIGTSATYITSSLINGQVVDVIVTNTSGCTATSAPITNFVNGLPFIFVTTPPTCSPDLTTYSLAVAVSPGIVTSTSGTVTNTGGGL